MNIRRLATPALAAAIALALTACGGGGSGDTTSAPTTQSTTQPTEPAKAGGSGDTSGSKLAAPGTHLKLGEEATVAWVPFSEDDATKAESGISLKATVTSIEEKSIDDLSGLELEPEEEERTPFFVSVRLTALTGSEPPPDEQPAITFTAVDDRGQEQTSATVFGEFPDCEEEEVPDGFTSGKSYESCFIYLVRAGGSIAAVQWQGGPHDANDLTSYYDEPVVWEAG